jgi:Na+/melibiose symporter-like transporter
VAGATRIRAKEGAKMEDVHLGWRFWLAVLGITIGVAVAAGLIFLLIAGAWAQWGLFAALIFFGAILSAAAYIYDRTHTRTYDDSTA